MSVGENILNSGNSDLCTAVDAQRRFAVELAEFRNFDPLLPPEASQHRFQFTSSSASHYDFSADAPGHRQITRPRHSVPGNISFLSRSDRNISRQHTPYVNSSQFSSLLPDKTWRTFPFQPKSPSKRISILSRSTSLEIATIACEPSPCIYNTFRTWTAPARLRPRGLPHSTRKAENMHRQKIRYRRSSGLLPRGGSAGTVTSVSFCHIVNSLAAWQSCFTDLISAERQP